MVTTLRLREQNGICRIIQLLQSQNVSCAGIDELASPCRRFERVVDPSRMVRPRRVPGYSRRRGSKRALPRRVLWPRVRVPLAPWPLVCGPAELGGG